jgi:hypothetical protein
VEEIEFAGKKHPKEKHDKKYQHKGHNGKAVSGGIARINEHLSKISNAKVSNLQDSVDDEKPW